MVRRQLQPSHATEFTQKNRIEIHAVQANAFWLPFLSLRGRNAITFQLERVPSIINIIPRKCLKLRGFEIGNAHSVNVRTQKNNSLLTVGC